VDAGALGARAGECCFAWKGAVFGRDAQAPSRRAAAAIRTERIRLGPCVAPIYMREPTYIAQLVATLDELSDGRAEVVFGIGNIAVLEQYGVEWRGTRPIARAVAESLSD
jgi:alkanesulfonate monooxygenase SsuD/methylene tetrahydromethanopterin reductase-like flavin-dependent oxidoreductase (luciferase family)